MQPAVELREVTKAYADPRGAGTVRAMDAVSLRIDEGGFFALLGPSGCGKTTTLRSIAGFEQPDSGAVLIRGRPVQGIPPFHRPVNTVFQDYALFPHMSVLQNVMFGLKMAKVPAREARRRAEEALELVHLPHVGARRPSQLSGGQRQRVALARALVNRPAVLLLDEPLGALDLKLRKAMQFELKRMQQQVGITFVFVTHDQEEAMAMADHIAVMDRGRVLQVGTPAEIYEHPVNRFVADFIGETNFLEGTLEASGPVGHFRLADGRTLPVVLGAAAPTSGPATLAVRPERIRLTRATHGTGAGGVRLAARVTEVHYLGTDTRYHLVSGSATLSVRQPNTGGQLGAEGRFAPGDEVVAWWQPDGAAVLRPE
ncbi:ABC transporter ATP-binding protein [Truepera radiovictrix]|uniref:Spermidine/putrescine import ATP-binding protein PotA n=1 Tax=Truepera radiovictrix (strain DSM 17093 / CIP 108686 / LMG 22925 / RQ-24) TaxID=649638 RepID=D7CX70_TRURR|nr:ABC transporter ATP-binding protein [Truepera radiovictrix]ADI13194.1 spermidine/putrescine ABC transporter ATPase subunit [Truepera radiovictrix DSM 17093]WMT58237.1 ABC transporter ATP-binding protein [Truepera radiovictrix]